MTALTGTGTLIRLHLRRNRIRLAVWALAIGALVLSTASSIKGLYPNLEELAAAAAVVQDNPAMVAMNGPTQGLDTIGGRVAWEVGAIGFSVMALMSMFLIGRMTREEEESGRAELVRSATVGRHAPTSAALIIVVGLNLLLGALLALGLVGQGLPSTGSFALAASMVSVGLVFAAATAVAAQIAEHTRTVYGITGAALGITYIVRAIGDIGGGTLTWLSPLGWAQSVRAFAGERWWPLLLSLAAVVLLTRVAFALSVRRDLGAGLVAPKPGPPNATHSLTRPLGLATRLQRGSLIGWSVGLLMGGLAYGSVGQDVEKLVGDNPDLRDMVAQAGGNLTDSFFATTLLMLALIGSGFAIQSTLRLRSEETSLRAEPLLATLLSRWRWAASHLVLALAGTVVVVGLGGLGTGLAYGIATGDLGQVPRLLGAALVYVPAVWVLVAVTFALFGLLPRAVTVAWAFLAACVVIGFLGALLSFPDWAIDVSPFSHVPQAPASIVTAAPLIALTTIASGLLAVGVMAFRRRDIG